MSIILYISKIDDCLKTLTEDEVRDILGIF